MKENGDVVLSDFGSMHKAKSNSKMLSCTRIYGPPELKNNIYEKEGDIWALGILFYILVVKEYPFEN